MSEVQADEPASGANSAVLRVRVGQLAGPLLRRVASMMLARTRCPIDRLQDAMLICDALGAHAYAHTENDQLQFTVLTHEHAMELRVGALTPGGAQSLAADMALPVIGDLLAPIVNRVRVESSPAGAGEDMVLEIAFAGASPTDGRSASKNGGPASPMPSPPPALHLADQAPSS